MQETPIFEEALSLAKQLSPSDQARLMEYLAAALATTLKQQPQQQPPTESLYGICADLGPAPSAEEIDEVRREMWSF
jgi:tRNA A37 threonylcarbamoyladenosine synthetase subunit TsaC/SUA5/YrdC